MQASEAPGSDGFEYPHEPRRFDWAAACIGLVVFFSFLLWGGVVAQFVYYVPRSQRLFADFHMRLPWITEVIVQCWWWMIPALIVASLGICLAIRTRWVWALPLIVLPLAIDVVVFVSMFWPTQVFLDRLGH